MNTRRGAKTCLVAARLLACSSALRGGGVRVLGLFDAGHHCGEVTLRPDTLCRGTSVWMSKPA